MYTTSCCCTSCGPSILPRSVVLPSPMLTAPAQKCHTVDDHGPGTTKANTDPMMTTPAQNAETVSVITAPAQCRNRVVVHGPCAKMPKLSRFARPLRLAFFIFYPHHPSPTPFLQTFGGCDSHVFGE